MSGLVRLCTACGRRADFIVEPVGRYDCMGWPDLPACAEHIGAAVTGYLDDDMPRIQVRFWDVASMPEPTECTQGCGNLVGDSDGWCLNCERHAAAAIATP